MTQCARTRLLADEFRLEADLIYLNHAALGPWPRRTTAAVTAFAQENLHRASRDWSTSWYAAEKRLRKRLRRLINAPQEDDIALLKNTSEALSLVAMGLDWNPGDNVVLSAAEFPSNRFPWQACTRFGVEVRLVDAGDARPTHEALLRACDKRTRVLTVSSVQFDSGERLALPALGAFCAERGILFGVDAIQSIGALPLDVQALGAAFLACGSHKWLLAPEGVAFLYTSPELRRRLGLWQFGWHMVEQPFQFNGRDAEPAAGGRRFEAGTLNTVGIIGLDASLSLYQELGAAFVESRILENSAFLIAELSALGFDVVTPAAADEHAGIVSLKAPDLGRTRALYEHLREHGVLTALRAGLLRLSPHYHTSLSELTQVVERLGEASQVR